ncbi:hypothetical protein [Pseudomonas yamanorum]|uniref:hypothetical protein n=1 Tax=Pseudomonas yamanorum TaxID=515393 RepID=UPI0008794DFA|nr:hypothetical protein [Pseudomonas yamanorum]SDT89899.1 hypothetical protein SAMN05216237_0008 [Pseudomonas yamanorum]SDU51545.1 hypothetical protein SAMN05216237_6703 [Pseudomonas yamanorum]
MTEKKDKKPGYQLTKKQHFHMKALLERFVNSSQKVRVVRKPFGTTSFLGVRNQIFIGKRSWSQETEQAISWPIETAFLAEVTRVEAGEVIQSHEAVSQYHLLWTLRHHFAKNPNEDRVLYPGMDCHMSEELEEWGDANYKVPIRNGGIIPGRFATTLDIKELLASPENVALYEGVFWRVIKSETDRFISPDQYRHKLLIVINPYTVLQGGYQEEPPYIASPEEVRMYNEVAEKEAVSFTFG